MLKDRIKRARLDAGMTQAQLAAACGWPYASRVGNYEQGKNEPDMRSLEQIADAVGVPVSALLVDPPDTARSSDEVEIPIYNARASMGAGSENSHSVQIGSLSFKRRSLERRGLSWRTLGIVYARGDSMSPTINDDDVVMYDTSKTVVRHREIYVVRVDDELFVKRLEKDSSGALTLISDNDADRRNAPRRIEAVGTVSVEIVGQVVWTAGWL